MTIPANSDLAEAASQRSLRERGFSLIELAVVLVIVATAIAGFLAVLTPQLAMVSYRQTSTQLAEVSDAIVAFAMVNRRLPCPATAASAGREAFCTNATGVCAPVVFVPPATGRGRCAAAQNASFVPAATLGIGGLRPIDNLLPDAWTYPIRYVTNTVTNVTTNNTDVGLGCAAGANTCFPFTQFNGLWNAYYNPTVAPPPSSLFVCASATGINAVNCNTATQLSNPAFVVYSTGANGTGTLALTDVDELANINADSVFVSHDKTEPGAANGAFDDLFRWVTVPQLLQKMSANGVFSP